MKGNAITNSSGAIPRGLEFQGRLWWLLQFMDWVWILLIRAAMAVVTLRPAAEFLPLAHMAGLKEAS
jgi:hypothetical protein